MVRILQGFLALTVLFYLSGTVLASENKPEQVPETKSAMVKDLPQVTDSNKSKAYVSPSSNKSEESASKSKPAAKAEPLATTPSSKVQSRESKESNEAEKVGSAAQKTEANAAIADLQVLEFVLANQVEGREPKSSVDNFTANQERGFAFARLQANTNSKVTFVWYRNGHEYARSTLPVNPSKKWRTYSSVKLRPGEWKVQLLAEEKVLAEKTFTLE